MPGDLLTARGYRRVRLILGIGWLGCLALGPYLTFEFGNYHGQVQAYREEHHKELYYREQKDRATGAEGYALETGQPSVLLPIQLQELEGLEQRYGALSLVWVFVAVGVWRLKQLHKQECPEVYN